MNLKKLSLIAAFVAGFCSFNAAFAGEYTVINNTPYKLKVTLHFVGLLARQWYPDIDVEAGQTAKFDSGLDWWFQAVEVAAETQYGTKRASADIMNIKGKNYDNGIITVGTQEVTEKVTKGFTTEDVKYLVPIITEFEYKGWGFGSDETYHGPFTPLY